MPRTIPWVLAFVALVLLATGCGNDDAPVAGNGDAPADQFPEDSGQTLTAQIQITDNEFPAPEPDAPSELRAPAGANYQLLLANNGDNPHTFTVEDLGVDSGTIEPGGGTAEVTFTFPDEPTEFICTVHPDQMQGTLVPE